MDSEASLYCRSITYVSIAGQVCGVGGCDVGKLEPPALRVPASPRGKFQWNASRSNRKSGWIVCVVASGWATGRTAAAARSVNSVGSDVDAEGDRHERHVVSSCTGGRRNLNTTASRDTGLLYSRRFLSGGGGWICYWRSYWRCWNRRRCRIDNSDGRLSDWRWLFDGQRSGNRLDQESRHLANLSNVKQQQHFNE